MNKLSKQSIVECIHQWGTSVLESILDPACKIFSVPGINGLIGYHTNRGCALVFGDPICSPEDQMQLVSAFHAFCEQQGKNVIYLVASESFAYSMRHNQDIGLINFGNELFLDPQCDPRTRSGKKSISLRGKIRHAEKNRILVNEYKDEIPDLELKIQNVANEWLKNRQGPQIYISRLRLFDEKYGKRWFYAQHGDLLVGSLVLNHVNVKKGWVLDRIMTVPNAPQGTSELMVLSVMETIAQEGCRFLTFGPTNGTSLGNISGFGKCTSSLAHFFYKASLKFFNLHQRGKYWEKFHPESSPAFIIFKRPRLGLYEIRALFHALNVSFFNKF